LNSRFLRVFVFFLAAKGAPTFIFPRAASPGCRRLDRYHREAVRSLYADDRRERPGARRREGCPRQPTRKYSRCPPIASNARAARISAGSAGYFATLGWQGDLRSGAEGTRISPSPVRRRGTPNADFATRRLSSRSVRNRRFEGARSALRGCRTPKAPRLGD
jgi:hypothetical protein